MIITGQIRCLTCVVITGQIPTSARQKGRVWTCVAMVLEKVWKRAALVCVEEEACGLVDLDTKSLRLGMEFK